MRKIAAAEAMVDVLDRENVRYVFGVPGGPILGLCDAIAKHPRIKFILTKHEQAAAYAAFTYAMSSNELGVCVSTLGPGATNLIAGLPVAAIESVPVLAITGQVQQNGIGRGGHQESTGWFGTPNQEMMFNAVCKNSATIADATHLPHLLRNSIRIARSDRPGPTHLALCSGILHETIDYDALEPRQYRLTSNEAVDDCAAVRIAKRIATSQAPVLLLGSRAMRTKCGPAAEALATRASVALVSDLSCKSIVDERHELYLGCLGVLGHKAAERFVKETSDLIITVGQTFDEITTLSWDPKFVQGRDLIQLDVYGEEIGKSFPVSDASVGCLPAILQRISSYLNSLQDSAIEQRRGRIRAALMRDPPFKPNDASNSKGPLAPERIIAELQTSIPADALILSDSSKWSRWLGRHFQATQGQILSAHDYEPMGWAVAGALGAKLAHPHRTVVCISGDGAFLMSAMELLTARNYGLKVIWLVMNDGRLGIIYDLQKALLRGRTSATTFINPDFVAFADAIGLVGRRVSEPGDLSRAFQDAIKGEHSFLIDVLFDVDDIPAVRPRSLLITKGMGLPDPTPGPETTRALLKLLRDK